MILTQDNYSGKPLNLLNKNLLLLAISIRILKSHLSGKPLTLGFDLNVEAKLDAVTLAVVKKF